MFRSKLSTLPEGSLLERYLTCEGCYTDCFSIEVNGPTNLAAYIDAFFDSWVFRIERRVLTLIGKGPATKHDVAALATGDAERFAAWTVTGRDDTQLLMTVPDTPIRTWLRVLPDTHRSHGVRLYFGSALVPPTPKDGAPARLPPVFRCTMGFHRLYSQVLLDAAARRFGRALPAASTT